MKRFQNIAMLIAVGSLLLISSCCDVKKPLPTPIKYSSIERVFMHDPGVYSFLYKDEATNELISVNTVGKNHYWRYHVYTDVKPEDFCWAEVDETKSVTSIHVHSSSEIMGGGWNHGKFGSGSTTPVE